MVYYNFGHWVTTTDENNLLTRFIEANELNLIFIAFQRNFNYLNLRDIDRLNFYSFSENIDTEVTSRSSNRIKRTLINNSRSTISMECEILSSLLTVSKYYTLSQEPLSIVIFSSFRLYIYSFPSYVSLHFFVGNNFRNRTLRKRKSWTSMNVKKKEREGRKEIFRDAHSI